MGWQKHNLPETVLSYWYWESRIFPVTFHGNPGAELLINGDAPKLRSILDFSVLIKTLASALPCVFQNNRNTDLLKEPMESYFTTFFLQGNSVVYQLGNM